MKVTRYHIPCSKRSAPIRIAVAADLHDNPYDQVIEALRDERPEMILIPGDLTDDKLIRAGASHALGFLTSCASIAPTFYSPGNHEVKCYHAGNPFRHPFPIAIPQEYRQAVAQTGAHFLDNDLVCMNGITVCGLSSGMRGKENRPDPSAMERFGRVGDGVKILLCHHPEYYMPYLRGLGMDLTVCGHAHGGHWRFFGRGVYSPGQGLFPKYTSGVIDKTCVISRGLGDHTSIPRLFNPTELLMITLGGDVQTSSAE